MGEIWQMLGFIRWPLAFSLVMVTALTGLSLVRLFNGSAAADVRTKAWVDAVLFWGGFAMVAGVLGTLIGVMLAAQSIEAAGAISTTLVWGGIRVALSSAATGALILSIASLLWFGLQLRWRLLQARAA